MKFLLQTFFKGLYYFLTDKNFRYFFYLCIRYGNAKRYQLRKIKIEGNTFSIPDAKSFIWQYYEIFFKKYYNFESKVENPIIIDCGANVGMSAFFFKKLYPLSNLHCFEADPKIFNYLQENLIHLNPSNTFFHKKAVWIKNESLNFVSEGADGGKISPEESQSSGQVEAIDFNLFLDSFEKIDFLKIDIEGAEISLIPHISEQLHKVDKLFLEYHSYRNDPQDLDQIISSLSRHGHRLFIQNETFRNQPFMPAKKTNPMDLQLNIFAYKV
jgi:FkbM family methyltransferase